MFILVTGGAGYIGSVIVQKLIDLNYNIIILDTLERGNFINARAEVIIGDYGDITLLERIFQEYNIFIVVHLGAYAYVSESIEEPIKYYENNFCSFLNLIKIMSDYNCNKLIFASTCSTFGIPKILPITENTPQNPINPYGESKLFCEKLINSLPNISSVIFRFFNVAGCFNNIGERHDPETHLIPNIFTDQTLNIYGDTYDTYDGTAARDYVHVEDIADAFVLAVDKIKNEHHKLNYNLGTGKYYTVLQLVNLVEKLTNKKIKYEFKDPRPGDPPILYTDNSKAKAELGWTPKHDINSILKSHHDFVLNFK